MNLFGFDVRALDVEALAGWGHLIWWVLGAAGVLWLFGRKNGAARPRAWIVILVLACLGHFLAWFVTMYPLPNIYGVNGSLDRENHLGWIQVIVAGNSPIRSFQVDQIQFEPLWPNLVALASLYRAELVGLVLQLSPLFAGLMFLGATYGCVAKGLGDDDAARSEAALAAFFALLLASAFTDETAPFRNPWALTFLLKPNHALGLVLTPLVLLAAARARTRASIVVAAFLLHVLGWVFIIHMAFVVSGLMVFAAADWLWGRREDRKRTILAMTAVIGGASVLVSPYVYMLKEFVSGVSVQARLGIQPQSAHTFDATLRLGLVFGAALYGAWSLARSENVFSRILAAQFIAAQIDWQIFHVLGVMRLGKEMDESFYWVRFITALVAGIGLHRLMSRALGRARTFAGTPTSSALLQSAAAAALSLAIAIPTALPGWWDPIAMDRYFKAALEPQPARVTEPAQFLRERTPAKSVVVGDRVYARYVAAFGARRVLLADSLNPPRDFAKRVEVESALMKGEPRATIEAGVKDYELRYLLVTPALLKDYAGVDLARLKARPDLHLVFEQGDEDDRVAIFEIVLPS